MHQEVGKEPSPRVEPKGEFFSGVVVSKYHPGELKSALQKYIRRSEVDKAVQAALELWRTTGPAHTAFINRLPIIAVEDVGWQYVAETVEFCANLRKLVEFDPSKKNADRFLTKLKPEERKALAEQLVVRITEKLAQTPKCKSACWVMDIGKAKHAAQRYHDWRDRLKSAMQENRPIDAAGIMWQGFIVEGEKYGVVFDYLRELATSRDKLAQKTIEAIRWRIAKGGARSCDVGIMFGAAALTLCRSPKKQAGFDEPEFWFVNLADLWIRKLPVPNLTLKVDWYCFDLHTMVGRDCLNLAVRKLFKEEGKIPSTHEIEKRIFWIGHLMFMEVGAFITPEAPEEAEFQREAFDTIYRREHKMSQEDAHTLWTTLEPRMVKLIKWMMDRMGK